MLFSFLKNQKNVKILEYMIELILYGDKMSKKFKIEIMVLILFSLVSIIFVYNDHFLYKTPIMKVTEVKNGTKDLEMFKETYYDQTIKGTINNGKYKGKTVTVSNMVSKTGVYGDVIKKGDELLIEISKSGEINEIVGVKRDKYLVILLVLFIDSIILVAGKQGIKTLISFFINIVVSAIAIFIFQKKFTTWNLLLLYMVVSVIFIVLSLFITNGKNKKTLSAIISSIVSLFISFGLAFLLVKIYGGEISIWSMEYIEAVYDYENFFYVTILLCGLGAIMDISITIASSLNELIEKNPKIKMEALIKSGKEISKDIVGTMTNVMLYTCYTPIVPMIFLAIKNNMKLFDALTFYGEVDLIAVFTSSISIVLAIPISLFIAIRILKPSKKEVQE